MYNANEFTSVVAEAGIKFVAAYGVAGRGSCGQRCGDAPFGILGIICSVRSVHWALNCLRRASLDFATYGPKKCHSPFI